MTNALRALVVLLVFSSGCGRGKDPARGSGKEVGSASNPASSTTIRTEVAALLALPVNQQDVTRASDEASSALASAAAAKGPDEFALAEVKRANTIMLSVSGQLLIRKVEISQFLDRYPTRDGLSDADQQAFVDLMNAYGQIEKWLAILDPLDARLDTAEIAMTPPPDQTELDRAAAKATLEKLQREQAELNAKRPKTP